MDFVGKDSLVQSQTKQSHTFFGSGREIIVGHVLGAVEGKPHLLATCSNNECVRPLDDCCNLILQQLRARAFQLLAAAAAFLLQGCEIMENIQAQARNSEPSLKGL